MEVVLLPFLFLTVCFGLHATGIFLHELSHIVVGKLCGWKPLVLTLGTGPVWRKFTLWDLEFRFTPFPFAGFAQAFTTTPRFFRLKRIAFALAGPSATFVVIFGLCNLYVVLHDTNASLARFLPVPICLQVFALASTLYPHWSKIDGRPIPNDVLQAWHSLRMTKQDVAKEVALHVTGAAVLFIERGQPERAKRWMEANASQLGAQRPVEWQMVWIHILLSVGKKDEAKQAIATLLATSPDDVNSRVALLDGLACLPLYYGHIEMLEESLRYVELAIKAAPDQITLQGTKISLLIELGRLDEGLALIDLVSSKTQSDNDRAIVAYYRALAHAKRGDQKTAQDLLQQAFKKFPECIVRSRVSRLVFDGGK